MRWVFFALLGRVHGAGLRHGRRVQINKEARAHWKMFFFGDRTCWVFDIWAVFSMSGVFREKLLNQH